MKNKSHAAANAKSSSSKRDKKSRRNAVVLALLLGSLTATSILLLVLAPAPLARSLYASQSMSTIFDTPTPMQDGRWKNIYIHHSKGRYTVANPADSDEAVGDHFLIGNGDGLCDGELRISRLWEDQKGAAPSGANLADNCISICLVGDFEQYPPTATQLQQLEELVKAIQNRCRIPAGTVYLYGNNAGPGGIGRLFPTAEFLQHLQ